MTAELTFGDLKAAMEGRAMAFRLTQKLEAVSPKVFPPTYEGGAYATEVRRIEGKDCPCVLLDSVASQANRMEFALQEGWDAGEFDLPIVSVDFGLSKAAGNDPQLKGIKITSLQAPHRIADAILRDSGTVDTNPPTKFKHTEIGKALDDQVSLKNATPLLKFAPHCLVFGIWHSTGDKRRAMGVKIPRALISEIIGVNAVRGISTSSRLDPLGIQKIVDKQDIEGIKIYKANGGGWTLSKELAEQLGGKPVLYGKKGKPSEINHGNVTPSIVYRRDKNGNVMMAEEDHPLSVVILDTEKGAAKNYYAEELRRKPVPVGGFTVDYAEQTTVLSLPALRRLRFPIQSGDRSSPDTDLLARTYLAALGLLSATLAVEMGYDLRSRCILRATDELVWSLLGTGGEKDKTFRLSRKQAIAVYKEALTALEKTKLPINKDEIVLAPSDDLVTLVNRGMELTAAEVGDTE